MKNGLHSGQNAAQFLCPRIFDSKPQKIKVDSQKIEMVLQIAEVAVTTFDACFPDSIVGFIPDHHLDRDFLYYLMVAMKPALLRATVITTQPNINYVQIGGNYIPLPPVKEQVAIVERIESKLQSIRELRSSLETQIATLTAYRKSLIHECVTGQRRISESDVRRAKMADGELA